MGEGGAVYLTQKQNKYMSKNTPIVIGLGNECPKCNVPMQRRRHSKRAKTDIYYLMWDYCRPCQYLQHYEEFKVTKKTQ